MKKTLLVTALCVAPILAIARDCVLIPGASFCAVPLTATQADFVKSIGQPDGSINMGPDRVGLVYGQRLMVIFWRNKLWQVHAWETNSNMDFWEYIRNKPPYDPLILRFKEFSPWGLTRKEFELKAKNFKSIDGDGLSDIRLINRTLISTYYSPTWDAKDNIEDWASYRVHYLKVEFGVAP